jgi:glycosyltransferase involved in cell wall biosynthesis
MHFPRITLVTPSLNQGEFIEETIDSVLSQGYPNLDYIIIDGGSSDNTINVVKKHSKYLSAWVSEKDEGQADAINKGIKLSTGEIFNWLNSDDTLNKNSLFAIADYFNGNPDKNIVCGYTKCFWNITNEISHCYRMKISRTTEETMYNLEMNQPGTYYKKAILLELGGLNKTLNFSFDDELWLRFLCKYGIHSVGLSDELIANFRLHDKSKSIRIGHREFLKERNAVYDFILSSNRAPEWVNLNLKRTNELAGYYIPKVWSFDSFDANRFTAYFALNYINSLYTSGNITEAIEAMSLIVQNNLFIKSRKYLSLRGKLLIYHAYSKIKRNFKG